MAGRLRYWKEKEGRFWARMAVPGQVQKIIGRSEIIEPLGGDRREALKKHPAAVTRLRAQITEAEAALRGEPAPTPSRDPITTADFGRAVWQRYTAAIEADETARAAYPTERDIAAALESLQERAASGDLSEPYTEPSVTLPAGYASADDKIGDEEREQIAELVAQLSRGNSAEVSQDGVAKSDPQDTKLAVIMAGLDYIRLKSARSIDSHTREVRLAALKRELAAGDLRSQGSENV